MNNICILTSRQSPFDARIFHRAALSLKNGGYKVTIIAPWKEDKTFSVNGIKIVGFKKTKEWSRKLVTLYKLLRASFLVKADTDVYYCCAPDVPLLCGVIIKLIYKNKKIIYDSAEHSPASWYDQYSIPFLKVISYRLMELWESWALHFCNYVLTANDLVKSHIISLSPTMKVKVILNCPPFQYNDSCPEKVFDICHVGGFSFKRGAKVLIEVMRMFKKTKRDLTVLLIGGMLVEEEYAWFTAKLKKYSLLPNIKLIDWLPYEQIDKHIKTCRIGTILFQPTLNNMWAGPPNKLFEYMKNRLAVFAPKYCIETKKIIEEIECGITVDVADAKAVYDALFYLLTNPQSVRVMGNKGYRAYLEKYNWTVVEKELLSAYAEL